MKNVLTEPPQMLPPLADFPDWGKDSKKRFIVTVSRPQPADEKFKSLIPAEVARLAELKRLGFLVASYIAPPQAEPWHAFLHFRETDAVAMQRHLAALPLAPWLGFEISEVA